MAAQVHRPAKHELISTLSWRNHHRRKSASNGQNAVMELEQEVNKLKEILHHEERMKHVLQQAMEQCFGGTPVPIPSFLPPKTKELLAELAMVNREITRLEHEMSLISHEISEMKASNANIGRWNLTTNEEASLLPRSASALPMRTQFTSGQLERPSDQSRSLLFINRAIKGEFQIHKFTDGIDKIRQPEASNELQHRKKNISRASQVGNLVSISPYKSRPSKSRDDQKIISHSVALSSTSFSDTSITSEDSSNQKWQPNKLSESIMKCLTCIFMRLIRTTRASEMEKPGIVSRSNQSNSLSSRSFRTEGVFNQKAGPNPRRDSQAQDPYGIFDVEGSIMRDIGPYKSYVIFTSNSWDAKSISSCFPLLKKLRSMINHLSSVDLKLLTHQQKVAFWINIYNACLMQGYLHHGHPTTPEKMQSVMKKAMLNIGGKKLNAKAIEQFILRQTPSNLMVIGPQSERDNSEDMIKSMYGLDCPEPNIIFALSQGPRSSPAVRIYTGEGITSELERAKLEYLQASMIVTTSKKIMLPRLLVSIANGIARDMESLVDWVCDQLPTSGSLRKCIMESFRGLDREKIIKEINLEVMQYDFNFQYLLAL